MTERANLKIAVGTMLTITVPAAICMSILGPTEATLYVGAAIFLIFLFLAAWMMGRGIPFDGGVICGVFGALATAPGLLLALSYFVFGEASWGLQQLTVGGLGVAVMIGFGFLTLGINPLSDSHSTLTSPHSPSTCP